GSGLFTVSCLSVIYRSRGGPRFGCERFPRTEGTLSTRDYYESAEPESGVVFLSFFSTVRSWRNGARSASNARLWPSFSRSIACDLSSDQLLCWKRRKIFAKKAGNLEKNQPGAGCIVCLNWLEYRLQ